MFVWLSEAIEPLSVYICAITPDKRLNQTEPVIAEVSAQIDRVTAQNRQIIATVTQQSDDIQFLLRETSTIKQNVSELKQNMSEVKQRMTGLESGQAELKQSVDMILQSLQSGNGRS